MTWPLRSTDIEIWGTVISICAPLESVSEEIFTLSCERSLTFFHTIDEKFSTFIEMSEVSRIRKGSLSLDDADPQVKEVARRCELLRSLTMGAFDPWAVPQGFDPSGFVKGWAAQEAMRFFDSQLVPHLQINAGGDVVVRGGYDTATPWRIGIRHPDVPGEIAKVVEIFDGAVASSGMYERGAHIIDPHAGVPAVGARAATVVGPDAGIADALATALIVDGRDSVNWMGAEEFRRYSFWAVDKSTETTWSFQHPEVAPR